ncbi:MAG: FGGY-family carbohydrate kinase [Neptunomonas phycophila]|uniref:FGGY-family carbohydrate kinase n=1 Tax=Neptunomonas phycophila TaxID=1572645 RepID=UPI003B8DDBCD
MHYVIGVDIGTQSTKALLVSQKGAIVAQASDSYQVDQPQSMWAEQWPQVWVDAVKKTIRAVISQTSITSTDIKAICVSSLYGGSGIPVDAQITPLYPCLIWMDRRADQEVADVKARVDLERLQAITGNGVDSYYGYTKMLWLKNHRSDVWAKTQYFLPPNSYVQYVLTGEIAVDHSSAGNIGGVYDMQARSWSGEMLNALGIPEHMMPERLVASNEIVGGLLSSVAQKLGLAPDTPVVAGGVDAAVATLAAGVTEPGNHVAMIGTSMCWGFINKHVDTKNGLISMPYVANVHEYNYLFGGAITAGASISWFREQFCQEEKQAARLLNDIDDHQLLEIQAKKTPAGADGVVFLPYLMGERSPIWDSNATGTFVGLSLYHRKAHLYRAVLEGVAFALRHNIECGEYAAEHLDDRLIVVGGAAHSDLWMQIIADITGYDVYTIEQEVEAPLGAALLAADAVGLIKNLDAIKDWRRLTRRAPVNKTHKVKYDSIFTIYKQLYVVMKDSMHTLKYI